MKTLRKRPFGYGENVTSGAHDARIIWDRIFSSQDKAGATYGRYFYHLALKRIKPGETICDAGCGHAFYLHDLMKRCGPHGSFIGIDISSIALAKSLDLTSVYSNAHLVLADMRHLPLGDDAMDRVFCSETLPYLLEDTEAALKELARVSRQEVIFSLHTRGTYEVKGTQTELRGNIVIEHKPDAKPPRKFFERNEILEMVRSMGFFQIEMIKPFRWINLMDIPAGEDWPWYLPPPKTIALYYVVAKKIK